MIKYLCPNCGSDNYVIMKARNENEIIAEKFLCSCLYSGNRSDFEKENIWIKFLKIFGIKRKK